MQSHPAQALGSFEHETLANLIKVSHRVDWKDGNAVSLACASATNLAYQKLNQEPEYAGTDLESLTQQCFEAMCYHAPRMGLPNFETVEVGGEECIELELGMIVVDAEGSEHLVTGKIDWAARSKKSGQTYVIDHKTTSLSQLGHPFIEHDPQLLIYRKLLEAHGVPVDGAVHHQLSASAPKQPSINKDGSVSARKINSDWPTVEAAILRAGGNPYSERYLNLREHTKAQVFRRWAPDLTTEAARERQWSELLYVLERMRQPSLMIYRNRRAFNCKRCDFRMWCDADLQGLDKSNLVGVHYHVHGDNDPPEEFDCEPGDALAIETMRSACLGDFDVPEGWHP